MGAPSTAGPAVRELMAEARVGHLGPGRAELRTVSLCGLSAAMLLPTRSRSAVRL